MDTSIPTPPSLNEGESEANSEPLVNQGPDTDAYSGDYMDYDNPSWKDRVLEFFSDRRKVLILAAVALLVLGTLIAVFAWKRGSDKASKAPASEDQRLPIAGGEEPDFIPHVARPGNGTLVVVWNTEIPTDGRVHYGTSDNFGSFADDQNTLHPSQYSTEHEVIIKDLDNSLTYHLYATSVDEKGLLLRSQTVLVSPIADSSSPSLTILSPTDGASVAGKLSVCYEAKDDQGIFSTTLLMNERPVAERRGAPSGCFDVDTGEYVNGRNILELIASDGVNSTKSTTAVFVENHPKEKFSNHISVSIEAPKTGEILKGTTDARAKASDTRNAKISHINLYVGGVRVGRVSGDSAAFSVDTNKYQDGGYDFRFVATNESGEWGSSTVRPIFKNSELGSVPGPTKPLPPPGCTTRSSFLQVRLTSPAAGSILRAEAPVSASVVSGDNVQSMMFMIGSVVIAEDTSSPYSAVLNTVNYANGQHLIRAVARSQGGQCSDWGSTGNHAAIVTISNGDAYGCRIIDSNIRTTLTRPVAGTTVGGVIGLSVSVVMPAGKSVSKVTYLVDGIRTRESHASPFSSQLDTARFSDGSHTVKAIAHASDGSCGAYMTNSGSHTAIVNFDNKSLSQVRITSVNVTSTDTSLTVTWQTNVDTDSLVRYGPDTGQRSSVKEDPFTASHSVKIAGLAPDTLYYLELTGTTRTGAGVPVYQTKYSTKALGGDDDDDENGGGGSNNCDGVGSGVYRACYYEGKDFTNLKAARNESTVDLVLAPGAAPMAGVPADNFSALWQGSFNFSQEGEYIFTMIVDDGGKLYIDGQRVLNHWRDQSSTVYTVRRQMSAGNHEIKLEYYQAGGAARAYLDWQYQTPPPTGCSSLDPSLSVELTKPISGSVLSGNVEVASATVPAQVQRVLYFIGSNQFASGTGSGYPAVLDTFKHSNGTHILKAVAQSANGRCSDWGDAGNHTARVSIRNERIEISSISVNPSDVSAVLTFKTSEPANSKVYLSTSRENKGNPIDIGQSTSLFISQVDGVPLSASTTYYYTIESLSVSNPDRRSESSVESFTTLNDPARNDMTGYVSWKNSCYNENNPGKVYFDRIPLSDPASQPKVATAATSGPGSDGLYNYSALLVNLQSSSTYYYIHETPCNGQRSEEKTFTTPAS